MGHHLDASTISLLYKSYVRPAVEYATPVWCYLIPATQLAMLDTLQAKTCRCILRSANVAIDQYESKNNLNKLCFLESLSYRRTYLCIIVLFKYEPHTAKTIQ